MTYIYLPYTAAPKSTDKNFINYKKGGYAHCISITSKGFTLPNCFHGDTEFITKEGIKTLKECAGKEVEVLTEDGMFRKAEVKNFGVQPLMRLKLTNGNTYYVTANHRWIVDRTDRFGDVVEHGERTTLELNTHTYIPYVVAQVDDGIDADGIRNGFIYGDGSLYNERKYSRVSLCGDKIAYMWEFFKDAPHYCDNANGTRECYPYPKEFKGIPSIDSSAPYLRGFIVGYFAADGHVDKKGVCHISSADLDDLKKVKDICSVIGIRTSDITTELRKGFGEEETPLYRMYFARGSFSSDMLLNPVHRQRFEKIPVRPTNYVRKVELATTDTEAEVFCVVEPVTHTFVLADNVLTGNCVASVHGMWLKTITDAVGLETAKAVESKMCRGNAEVYWNYNDGFSRGQTPKLNAIMVWEGKGKRKGHVMTVTTIKENGDVIGTGSDYGGSKFYKKTYYKSKGYNFSSNFTFKGFIYCPIDFAYTVGDPVQRNTEFDQLKVSITNLRARSFAGTDGTVMGYVNPGLYDVTDTKKLNGYTWYEIEPGMWCALVKGVEFLEGHPLPRYTVTVTNVTEEMADTIVKAAKAAGATDVKKTKI